MAAQRLAAIMFTDIVGYTTMMQHDRKKAIAAVHTHEDVLRRLVPHRDGELIQTYGDGSLSIFNSASAAVECARLIQEELRHKVPLRIGLHIGEIQREGDHTFGDGVNIASRIESLGQPGTILFSREFYNRIRNRPEILVQSLGFFEFKNVDEPMEIFALANEGFPVPRKEEMEGKLKTPVRPPQKIIYNWKWLLLAFCLIIAGVFSLTFLGPRINPVSGEVSDVKSIAILPFRNLSSDVGQDYFAEGIVEAIQSKLASIDNLKVTSMTSVLSYRQQPKPIPIIAKELQVAHILEGSVMKDQDKVRIVVKLLDANKDRQIWAETYDRNLVDIFNIQTNIAQSVVNALKSTLTPAERGRLARIEVADISAYDLYLSALNDSREYVITGDTVFNESALRKSHRAISKDPQLDEAFTIIADSWFARSEYGYGEKALDSAAFYVDQALSIQPLNENALIRNGWIAWKRADFHESKQYAEKALAVAPNSSRAMRLLALFHMQVSETVEQAVPLLLEAISLDPNNQNNLEGNMVLYQDLGNIYLQADLLDEAQIFYEKALELASINNSLEAIKWLGYIHHIKGDFEKSITYRLRRLDITPQDFGAINEYAGAQYAAGNYKEAEKYYRLLLEKIARGFRETSESYIFRHRLAHILWLTGRKEEAMKIFQEHLKNEMMDLAGGTRYFGQEYAIAGAYAAMGDKEKAFEWLAAMPFWFITYQYSRVDPIIDSLRDDPRFQSIMQPHRTRILRLQQSLRDLETQGQIEVLLGTKNQETL